MSSHDGVLRVLVDNTRRLILAELSDNSEQMRFELYSHLTMEHGVDLFRQGVSEHVDVLAEAGRTTSTHRGTSKVTEFAGADRITAATVWLDGPAENGT